MVPASQIDITKPFTIFRPDVGAPVFGVRQRVRLDKTSNALLVSPDSEGRHIVVHRQPSLLNGLKPVYSYQIEPYGQPDRAD